MEFFAYQNEEEMAGNEEMQCVRCMRQFGDFSFQHIMFLEQCCHLLCKMCFKELIRKVYSKGEPVCCPRCEKQVLEVEIKEVIGD